MEKIFCLAPMEGITGYIYRNAFHKYFGGTDFYITPFISPTQNKILNHKELEDILPENNRVLNLVPQILTNSADLFTETARVLSGYGYSEINLNLGCPSGTVAAKGRGAGFLADLDRLDDFLMKIYNEVNGKMKMDISVKTRIGVKDSDEFLPLLAIFNQYPIKLLTIHPRVQKEFYKGKCHIEVFERAVMESKNKLCYNGDLNTVEDFERILMKIPSVDYFMIGRGILRKPYFLCRLKQRFYGENLSERSVGESRENAHNLLKKRLRSFHDEIYCGYEDIFSGDRNVLFKMKELWSYMIESFNDGDKALKKIKKAQRRDAYFEAVDSLFELELNI